MELSVNNGHFHHHYRYSLFAFNTIVDDFGNCIVREPEQLLSYCAHMQHAWEDMFQLYKHSKMEAWYA